jgi:hypothetical protein
VGLVASALAFLGVYSGTMILAAAICYSSIKCVGSVFTQLQMHAHIMEIDMIYIACAPFIHIAPTALVVLASLLNFRVMMGGGAGKWFGGDKSWRDGTAMSFHYWTQPLPNPLSPFMHRLPTWVHRLETYASMVCESFCALFVFAPVYLRFVAFVGFVSLMLLINLTGNFCQISVLTLNESILLLNDRWWTAAFNAVGYVIPGVEHVRRWFLFAHSIPYADFALAPSRSTYSTWNICLGLVPYVCFVLPYALVQIIPLVGTFRGHNALELFEGMVVRGRTLHPLQWYREALASSLYTKHVQTLWHKTWELMERAFVWGTIVDLFSSYVKFGHMTKFRHEIQIEASLDGVDWREYQWRYKPSLVTKRPPFWPFHLPCIDWRCWFLPLEHSRGSEPPLWFMRIEQRLLECEPSVLDLFQSVPFDGVTTPRPQFIRAVLYDYRFAYQYEKEDELKRLVKQYRMRDTEIDSGSEEEIEVPIEEKQAAPVRERRHVKRAEERKTRDAEDAERAHGMKDSDFEEKKYEEADAEPAAPIARQASKEYEEKEPHSAPLTGSEEDESDDEAESLEQRRTREMLARLLGIHLPAGPRRRRAAPGHMLKRVRKVTQPVPQVDEHGERVWYVRRHKIANYGPILTTRKAPPREGQQRADTWESFLEGEEQD